jgi:hypothetical protein
VARTPATRHLLTGLFRQSVFGRLAGDVQNVIGDLPAAVVLGNEDVRQHRNRPAGLPHRGEVRKRRRLCTTGMGTPLPNGWITPPRTVAKSSAMKVVGRSAVFRGTAPS